MPIEGVPSAAATCSRPESLETATEADASARMASRRSWPVRSRASVVADDLRRQRLFVGAAQHPDRKAVGEQAAGQRGIGRARPAFRRSDRARRQRHDRPAFCSEAATASPGGNLGRRHFQLRHRPVARQSGAGRQRQRGAAIDHARQAALAEAQIVEQEEPRLADEAGALRNAGEKRRQRRFPGARHDQRRAVVFLLEAAASAFCCAKARLLRGRSATMAWRRPGM